MMKNGRKIAALLACVLLLGVLLSACGGNKCSLCGKSIRGAGHSTSAGLLCDDCYNSFSGLGTTATRSTNTGVWIAITVMVFVAVFAATSGVVYLVLQKLLPPDAAPGRPARRMPRKDDYDDIPVRRSAPRPAAPAQRPASPNRAAAANRPAAPRAYAGEWVCPRDRSRNSGPYCTLCGAPRPQAPRPAAPRPAANGGAQRPAQPAAQPMQSAPQPVQRQPQAQSFQPAPKAAPAPAWQEMDLLDAYLTEPTEPAFTEAAPLAESAPAEAAPTYSGKFARKPQNAEQPPAPQDVRQEPELEEPEYDAELLAAIFRQAEQGTDEN